jgi:hypothetical protein
MVGWIASWIVSDIQHEKAMNKLIENIKRTMQDDK